MTDQPHAKPTPRLNLRAYYYGFEPTGCEAVDKILGAVAYAGKAFHSTSEWQDEMRDGTTCIERIQNAANSAAKETAAERDRLVKALEDIVRGSHRCRTPTQLMAWAQDIARAALAEAHR